MAIPASLQVEYTTEVPLQLVRDKKGMALDADTAATVAVLLVAEGGDICSVYCEGPLAVWFHICSAATGRATYGCEPIEVGNKEVFLLPDLPNRDDKNYISVIARGPTKCTVNTYPRGT